MAKTKEVKLTEWVGGNQVVICPECANEFVHIKDVIIDRGGNVLRIEDEVSANLTKVPSKARGVIITLGMWCEDGHEFSLFFQFHKGSTMAWTELVQTFDLSLFFPGDLWRD